MPIKRRRFEMVVFSRIVLIVLVVHACLGAAAPRHATLDDDPTVGDTAPELDIERWHNTEHPLDLKTLRGKVVLLDFWGIWCTPCVKAIPELKTLAADYEDADFQVVMVHTPMKSDQIAAFLEKRKLTLPVGVDRGEARSPYGETTSAYGVESFPGYFLIDKKGVLRTAKLDALPSRERIDKLLAE